MLTIFRSLHWLFPVSELEDTIVRSPALLLSSYAYRVDAARLFNRMLTICRQGTHAFDEGRSLDVAISISSPSAFPG